MPYSNIPEALTGKMERCVDSVMKQGNDKRTAIAICYNSIMGKKQGQFIANVELPLNTILSEVKARPTFQPPKAAQESAQRVLRWREEYPDEIQGMTDVGWGRALQLAEGKPVSLDTVRRMAQFNRHRQNSEIAPEYKGTPWKDAGYVAWLGWGGTEGIDWAKRTHTSYTEQTEKAIAQQFIIECEYKGCSSIAQYKLSVGDSEFHYCAAHIQGAKQVFEGHGIKEYHEAILEPVEVELVNNEDRFVWDETQVMETEKKETVDTNDEKQHTSAMIALRPSPELAQQLAVAGGEEPEALHVTLLYIDPSPEDKRQVLETLMRGLTARVIPVKAKLNGITLFTETHIPDKNAVVLNVDSPQLIGLREIIDTMLREVECYPKNDHGFTPHMTLAYVDKDTVLNPVDYNLPTEPIYFYELWLVWKDEWIPFQIRKFDSKAGRFITTDGRVIFIGGPSQGGGSSGAGAESKEEPFFRNIDGTLTEFFHGGSKIEQFKTGLSHTGADIGIGSEYGEGVYLTSQRWKARGYAEGIENGHVTTVVTTVSNPLFVELGNEGKTYESIGVSHLLSGAELSNAVIDKGYDSIAALRPNTNIVAELVIFDPSKLQVMNSVPKDEFDWKIIPVKSFVVETSKKETSVAQQIAEQQDKVDATTIQSELLGPWLITTMGTEDSNRMQKTVAKTFGHSYPAEFEELDINWNLLYAVGAIYNLTQEWLKEKGFSETETIPVYHPYLPNQAVPKLWQEGDTVRIKLNPLTSWTLDLSEAVTFAEFLASPGSPTFVLKTFIPISSVVSTPETGFGVPGTNEVVLAGGEYEAVVEQRFE